MAAKVKAAIVEEIKKSKYYAVSIDSTPDISHVDQLTVIIRYVNIDGIPIERFVGFVPIKRHDGEYLFDVLSHFLSENGINIMDCRGQSYDNASNMSGIYSGVQARFCEVNRLAEWIPCAAHSLNLVGVTAAECCLEAVNFFGIVQSLYNFLSGSPQRWSKLIDNLPSKVPVLKSLSETRWSARSDATKALTLNYQYTKQALIDITKSDRQLPTAIHDAKSLVKKLEKLNTPLMCVIWNDILENMNRINKALQEPGIEIGSVVSNYETLQKYLTSLREHSKFDNFEEQAKSMVSSNEQSVSGVTDSEEYDTNLPAYSQEKSRVRKRKSFHDERQLRTASTEQDQQIVRTAREQFRIETYLTIVDKLRMEIDKRKKAYSKVDGRF